VEKSLGYRFDRKPMSPRTVFRLWKRQRKVSFLPGQNLSMFFHLSLNDLSSSHKYCSGDKIEKKRWAGHVESTGRVEVYTVLRWGKLRETEHMEDPGVDGRIILRLIFRKCDVECGLDRAGSG
jgi:hypothetical protein